jgi:hypothetical protein
MEGYLQTVRIMLLDFGIPVSTYSDRHTIFFSPKKDKLSLEAAWKEGESDPIRTGYEPIGIGMICARTPQAKGQI